MEKKKEFDNSSRRPYKPRKYNIEVGMLFGQNELISFGDMVNGKRFATIRCTKCGKERTVNLGNLTNGSCNGCICNIEKLKTEEYIGKIYNCF